MKRYLIFIKKKINSNKSPNVPRRAWRAAGSGTPHWPAPARRTPAPRECYQSARAAPHLGVAEGCLAGNVVVHRLAVALAHVLGQGRQVGHTAPDGILRRVELPVQQRGNAALQRLVHTRAHVYSTAESAQPLCHGRANSVCGLRDALDAVHDGLHLAPALLKRRHLGIQRLGIRRQLGRVCLELGLIGLQLRSVCRQSRLVQVDLRIARRQPVLSVLLVLLQRVDMNHYN